MNGATELYASHFGEDPGVVVRAPGRINIIGDHTDYCGLPVLPMAIGQAVYVAGGERSAPGLTAISSLDGGIVDSDATREQPPWSRYVLAVLAELRPLAPQRGANLALDSDLPATGGLSSSSALTVGCLTALNELWDVGLPPDDLVVTALAAERKAAIAGGAMDQTVITFARPGHALRIDFDPPLRRNVPIPDGFAWIAGYSGTRAPKGETALDSYHSFVLASRAAAVLLGDDSGAAAQLSRVRHATAEELAGLPTVTVADAAHLAGDDDLGLPLLRRLDLRVSAEHVLAEAERVDLAETALRAGDLPALGELMTESHHSLRRYGSSTPDLDKLVAAAAAADAAGARVTGAGFGGWAIALSRPDLAQPVADAMEAACGGPTFLATPQGGALWSLRRE